MSRFLNHDIDARQSLRDSIAAATAEWEAKHGPVVTEPIRSDWANPLMVDPETLEKARKRGGVAGSRHRQVKSNSAATGS